MISTNINYPTELPAPQWAENSYAVVSPNLRSNMESGRARQRRAFSSVPVMRQAAWVFTSGQANSFEFFYKDILKDGTEWFNIKLRHPMGFRDYVCRVVGVYAGPTAWGANRWKITATLELWERPSFPPGWEVLPGFIYGASIFDIAMNREWPAS